MAKYEVLPTTQIRDQNTLLQTHFLPELVHLDDPEFAWLAVLRIWP